MGWMNVIHRILQSVLDGTTILHLPHHISITNSALNNDSASIVRLDIADYHHSIPKKHGSDAWVEGPVTSTAIARKNN
jgi:hypothetical protein